MSELCKAAKVAAIQKVFNYMHKGDTLTRTSALWTANTPEVY